MKSKLWPFLLVVIFATACEASAAQPAATATTAGSPTVKAAAVQSTAPSPTVAIKATASPTVRPAQEANITIGGPKAGDTVKSPVKISGTARVFEGALVVAVKDSAGKVLATRPVQATVGAPDRGTYSVDLPFAITTNQAGSVEAYSLSPKDGSVQDLVSVKVTLAK